MNSLGDLARVTTATTGTGTLTLGAPVAGYLTFAQAGVPDGSTVSYGIADGSNSETGSGIYSGGTLTRSVYRSTASGNTAPINLSGAAQVFVTALSADLLSLAPLVDPVFQGNPRSVTPPPADNDTSIATTAWVTAKGYLAGNQTITLSGAVSGSGTTSIATTLATVPVASGGTGSTTAATARTALGAVNIAGDQITGNLDIGYAVGTSDAVLGIGRTRTANGYAYVDLFAQGGGGYSARLLRAPGAAGNLQIENVGAGATVFRLNGADRLTLDAAGNATFAGTFFLSTGAQLRVDTVNYAFQMPTGTGAYLWYNGLSTPALISLMDNTGNFTIYGATATKPGGGPWVAPSDRSLKSAATPWHTGLAEVLQLSPLTYRYNNAAWNLEHTDYIGLDAEAAAAIIPEMGRTVSVPADPGPGQQDPPGGVPPGHQTVEVAGIEAGPLLYAVVNAIKEIAARLDKLEHPHQAEAS